ncbi:MAG TPA: sugar ABC transporter substrate-binding protein [Nakamurella sp.]|jgi:ABC-type glycerol-3-phosphate transport system substrate-binding protein|nr:sugar ABC transporter substrate-binding protein [Nakamurella sp.]
MTRRSSVFAAALAAAALVLGGCATAGGGGSSSSAPATTSAGGASSSAPAETSSGAASSAAASSGMSSSGGSSSGASGAQSSAAGEQSSGAAVSQPAEKVTLRFQSLAFQDTTIAATKKIVDDWNAANPNIQVELVQGSWDNVHDQLVTQFQGKTAPDIIHDAADDILGFAQQGYLADLSPYLSPDVKSGVSEGVWKSVTVDGKVIAAPTLLQTYVVFANSKALSDAGVTAPTGDTMSWDDFQALAKQLTKSGQYGLGWSLKSPTATMMNLALNFGGTYFDTSSDPAKITVGDKEMQVPTRIHAMAYDDKSIDPTSMTQSGSDVLPAFYAGKFAMMVSGDYVAQQISEQAPSGFTWQVLPPLAGDTADQAADPQTLSVSADCKNPKEATEFINYFMQAANLAAVAQGDWLIPATQSARDEVLKETGGKNGWDQILASGEHLTNAPFLTVAQYPQWKDQIATPAFQQYLADQIDKDALVSQLSDGWSQVAGG